MDTVREQDYTDFDPEGETFEETLEHQYDYSKRSNSKPMWTPDKLKDACYVTAKLDLASRAYMRQDIKAQSGYPIKVIDAYIQKAQQEYKQEEQENYKEEVHYSCEQRDAAETLACTQNLFQTFPKILDSLDYVTDKWRAQSLLLVIGLTMLDKERLICFWGETGDGKTEAAQIVLNLLDYERRCDKVREVLDCSPEWIKYAGGDDGKGLKNRLVFFDEMNPVKPGQDDRRQELIRQLDNDQSRVATFEIVDRIEGRQIGARRLQLEKPIYLLITSITPPHKWDSQNRSRFIFLEFALTPEQVENAQKRIAKPTLSKQGREDVFKAFNYFLHKLLERQDYNGILSLQDIQIPFLDQLIRREKDSTGADIRRFKLLKASIQASLDFHVTE